MRNAESLDAVERERERERGYLYETTILWYVNNLIVNIVEHSRETMYFRRI